MWKVKEVHVCICGDPNAPHHLTTCVLPNIEEKDVVFHALCNDQTHALLVRRIRWLQYLLTYVQDVWDIMSWRDWMLRSVWRNCMWRFHLSNWKLKQKSMQKASTSSHWPFFVKIECVISLICPFIGFRDQNNISEQSELSVWPCFRKIGLEIETQSKHKLARPGLFFKKLNYLIMAAGGSTYFTCLFIFVKIEVGIHTKSKHEQTLAFFSKNWTCYCTCLFIFRENWSGDPHKRQSQAHPALAFFSENWIGYFVHFSIYGVSRSK